MEYLQLSNGVPMPRLIQGVPLIGELSGVKRKQFKIAIKKSIECGIRSFDTSHEYGNSEKFLGNTLHALVHEGIARSDFFVISKIGNGQQYEGEIERDVDTALRTLKLDYLDLMLLHWPVPNVYLANWHKLEKAYKSGKVKAIGIANAQVRHLVPLVAEAEVIPHVLQTEVHPFNTNFEVRDYCRQHQITVQACSSLCVMIDKVRFNPILVRLAEKYGRSVAQIMLRWSMQNGMAPIFRAFNNKHIEEMSDLYNFEITSDDISLMDTLNENYRYHPESLNCPGF